QPADGVAVEVGQAEALDVAEDLAPEVVHDALADPGGEDGLRVLEGEGDEDRAEERGGEDREQPQVSLRDGAVQHEAGDPGPEELERGAGEEQRSEERRVGKECRYRLWS